MYGLIDLVLFLSLLPTAVLSLLVIFTLELIWRWRKSWNLKRPFLSTLLTGVAWGGLFELIHATSSIFEGGGESGAIFSVLLLYFIIPLSTGMAVLLTGFVYLRRGRPFYVARLAPDATGLGQTLPQGTNVSPDREAPTADIGNRWIDYDD